MFLPILILLNFYIILRPVTAYNAVELTDETFSDFIGKQALVMFYAPWCGHCKQLKPIFDKASDDLSEIHNIREFFGKVDCDENSALCQKYGVQGYPTLKVFINGEVSPDHENIGRDEDSLIDLALELASPAFTEISSVDELILSDDYQIVGFGKDSKENEIIKTLCKGIKNVKCAIAAKDLPKSHIGKIVLYQPEKLHNIFFPKEYSIDISSKPDVIKKFVEEKIYSLGNIRTKSNQNKFKEPLCVAYYHLDFKNNAKNSKYWRNRLLKAAQAAKLHDDGGINLVISPIKDFAHEIDQFGLPSPSKDLSSPPVIGCTIAGKKYPMKEVFSVENGETFFKKLMAGEIESFLKSEPIPEEHDGHVKIVVGKTFDEIVNGEKDVLIEFYAPWCGHCKKLAPIYKEVAEKLKDDIDHVVIAKIDATANDYPDTFGVKGYPTLFWIPKGSKIPIPYEGGREMKDIINFIAKKSTKELTKYDRKGKSKDKAAKAKKSDEL